MTAPSTTDPRRVRPIRTTPAAGAARTVRAVLVLLVGALALIGGGPTPPAVADGLRPTYRPPVVAPVRDPFRAPPHPWAPGNRGIEYATVPGTVVRAIGPGTVIFAGPVAGSRHVTIRHPDGLRSSYAFLAAIRARVGDRVTTGSPVGVAGPTVHLGVRRGDTYLDPALLWGRAVGGGAPRLVPEPSARGRGRGRPPGPAASEGRTGPAPIGPGLTWGGLRLGRLVGASLHSYVGPPLGGSQHVRPGSSHGRWCRPAAPAQRSRVSFNRWEERRDHDRACRVHEAAARRRCALRPPDPPLEPQDEALHLR